MTQTIDNIRNTIITFISNELEIEEDEIDREMNLGAYGLGSVSATTLTGILEDTYDLTLSPLLIFDYPTVDSLSLAIGEQMKLVN